MSKLFEIMLGLIAQLNRNKIFKYLSSVKSAVPLMLLTATAVAWGTVVESKYNADLAKLLVYNSWWFTILLVCLWINILCATISRVPFKLHHLGFVITHIGLLLLLAGGVLTTVFGIDGSLRVEEGQSENIVALPQTVVGVAPQGSKNFQTVEVKRSFQNQNESDLKYLNAEFGHLFLVKNYYPFAEVKTGFVESEDGSDVALSFILKSQFFNVSEYLHSSLNPVMKMGPATLELVVDSNLKSPEPKSIAKTKKPVPTKNQLDERLLIMDVKTGQQVFAVKMSDLQKKKSVNFQNIAVHFVRKIRKAVVGQGGIQEDPNANDNPALEIKVMRGNEPSREILFARFPEFSMSKTPVTDIKFVYESNGLSAEPDNPVSTSVDVPVADRNIGNLVRFRVPANDGETVRVELLKDGNPVLAENLKPGSSLQTPWMGIKLTVGSLIRRAKTSNEVNSIRPVPLESLPPSAIQLASLDGKESLWLAENESRVLTKNGRQYEVYLGRKIVSLPFQIQLKKFQKIDYPGTDTPMSFESDVIVTGKPEPIKISMNEPLVEQGFTIYQASYQLNPGGPATSVFSVNKDPGRSMKYFGSLILCLGIIIFTLMRSRVYLNWKRSRA